MQLLHNPKMRWWAGGLTAAVIAAPLLWHANMAHYPDLATDSTQDMLQGTFQYMPGAAVASDGTLRIARTGQAILSFEDDTQPGKAETSFVANPPINVYGTHIALDDANEFGVHAELADMQGSSTLSLYSGPSIRYDERIARLPSMDVQIADGTATVTTYGKPGAKPSSQEFAYDPAGGRADVEIAKDGKNLFVTVNGAEEKISGGKDADFSSDVWLGMDTSGSYTVQTLGAIPLKGSGLKLVDTSSKDYIRASRSVGGLAAQAAASGRGDKLIGTAVDLPVLMADPAYAKFIIENFNEIETEMLAKFQALQPEEGNFQFGELDALVDFAAKHNLTVHGHTLAFGEAYPKWLQEKLARGDKAEAQRLLETHIRTVVSRYDGKHGHGLIRYWDVVNEPFSADDFGTLSTYNLWYKALGKDYMRIALDAARAANPDGVFGINENAMETDQDRRSGMRALVAELNSGAKRVDFVGFQAHFDEDTLDDGDAMGEFYGGALSREFAYYAGRGVQVRLSEVTVAENDNQAAKAKVYGQLALECAQAANCFGLNVWGATNNSGLYFYNTGNIVTKDAGDDAPTTQNGIGPVQKGAAFDAIVTAFTSGR